MAILCASVLGWPATAHAATETFPSSIFSSANITDVNNVLGNTPDTAFFARGSGAVFVFDEPVTNHSTIINVTSVLPATTFIWFRFGQVTGGAFQNAVGVGLTNPAGGATANAYVEVTGPGPVNISPTAFTDSCRAIGGCNAVLVGGSTFTAPGGGFFASSIVSSTPEPTAWSLMILAFVGLGFQVKRTRRRTLGLSQKGYARANAEVLSVFGQTQPA